MFKVLDMLIGRQVEFQPSNLVNKVDMAALMAQ